MNRASDTHFKMFLWEISIFLRAHGAMSVENRNEFHENRNNSKETESKFELVSIEKERTSKEIKSKKIQNSSNGNISGSKKGSKIESSVLFLLSFFFLT